MLWFFASKSKYFSPGSRGWWTERSFWQLYMLNRSSEEPGPSIDSRGKQRQTGFPVSPVPRMPVFRWDGCRPCWHPLPFHCPFWLKVAGILPSRDCPKFDFLQHDGGENSKNVDGHKQELQQRLLWNVSRLFSQIQDRPLLAVRASCPGRAKERRERERRGISAYAGCTERWDCWDCPVKHRTFTAPLTDIVSFRIKCLRRQKHSASDKMNCLICLLGSR